VADFDVDAFIRRFRERAEAVKDRGLPPVAGEERVMLIRQAEQDFIDYRLVSDANWSIEDGFLVLRLPLAGEN